MPACSHTNKIILPSHPSHLHCLFLLFILSGSSHFLFSPLGEQQRKSGRSAVCLTFEVGLLCRARLATCWLCVCACECVQAEVNLSNFDEQRQQRSHHGDVAGGSC